MSELPKAPVARLMKRTGVSRISGDAVYEMSEAMEDYGLELAARAKDYAHHAGRKTVKAEDIKLALK